MSEPRNVTVTSLESNRLNITWKIPLITNNNILSYTVFYKSNLKVEKYWNESRDIVGFEASLHVKPHRKYEIFVMAKSNASYGVPSVRITSSLTPSAGIVLVYFKIPLIAINIQVCRFHCQRDDITSLTT